MIPRLVAVGVWRSPCLRWARDLRYADGMPTPSQPPVARAPVRRPSAGSARAWGLLVSLASFACAAPSVAQEPPPPRVLFLTHSAGFRHGVVTREDPARPSLAERALAAAAAGRFDVTVSQDASLLAADLDDRDALVFFTTGDLPIPDEARDALLAWVREGGALVGVHSASDTFHGFAPYREMIGGTFDGHPWTQEVRLDVRHGDHPAARHLGEVWTVDDEIYQFRDVRPEPLRSVLTLDPDSVDISLAREPSRVQPVAWWRDYGRGRVFYTALGHRDALWSDAAFLEHLLAAVDWAVEGPDLPAPVPAGAVVLLDADDPAASAGGWCHRRDGADFAWRPVDGAVEVVPGTSDILSRADFGDALLHVEFRTPHEPDDAGQARGNSGVYVQGRYEVQVLDSFGDPPGLDRCGAVYGVAPPALAVARRPERWQSYDIRFTAPRFDAEGARTSPARLTVWHNGILVHEDLEVPGPTAAGLSGEVPMGPLLLQDHGDKVRYRNVWVLPSEG